MFLKEPVLENEIENPIHKTVVPVILCREPKCPGLRRQIVSKTQSTWSLRPNTTSLVTILYHIIVVLTVLLLNIKNASAS